MSPLASRTVVTVGSVVWAARSVRSVPAGKQRANGGVMAQGQLDFGVWDLDHEPGDAEKHVGGEQRARRSIDAMLRLAFEFGG